MSPNTQRDRRALPDRRPGPRLSAVEHAARIAGAAAVLLAGAAAAQPPVACASSDAAICRMIASREFLTAYQGAYRQGSDPADAVDELRFNMRRVLTGAGRAGPGAVSQQIDVILDDALRRTQQQLCAASPDFVARRLRACGRPGPRSQHARCAVVRRDAWRNDGRSPRLHTVRPRGLGLVRRNLESSIRSTCSAGSQLPR